MAKPSPVRAIAVAIGLLLALLLPLFALRCNSAVRRPDGDDDITLKAKELGFDVGKCIAFVDDEVKYESYPGFLRGPTGTLWAASGSDADRAALLKALLERCGAEAEFTGGPSWGVLAKVKGKKLLIPCGERGAQTGAAKEPDASEFPLIKFRLGSGTTWIEKEWRVADLATGQVLVVFDEKGESAGISVVGADGERGNAGSGRLPVAGLKRLDLVIECRSVTGTVTTRTREIFTREFEGTPARVHADNVYSIFVTAGWIPDYARERDNTRTKKWKDRVAAFHRRTAFSFLARSDAFARQAAAGLKVTARFEAPRVTIVSSERDEDRVVVSIDLRKNDIRCDGPAEARIAFNSVRSLHDGSLESQVIQEATGAAATSANDLLANAFTGTGATLSERQGRIEAAIQRMLTEAPAGSVLRVTCGTVQLAIRKNATGVAIWLSTPGSPEKVIADAPGLEEIASAVVAELASGNRPDAPLHLDYSEREVDRWYKNCRLFYLWGAESRLEFEKQFTAFEPALEIVSIDYYDQMSEKWLDSPWRGTCYVAKEDLEKADTFTIWHMNLSPQPVGYTIDMLSRSAFRELKEKGSVVLKVIGANEEKLEPIRFFLMSKQQLSIPVNSEPRSFDVLWIEGEYESKNPKMPKDGKTFPGVKDSKGFLVSNHYVLDDPDYPFFIPWTGFIQTSVQGRVVDAATGHGLEGARVFLKGPDVTGVSWPGGTFTFPTFRTPFAEFEVRAEADGYEPFVTRIDFRDSNVFPLRLELMPLRQGEPFAFVTKDTLASLADLAIEEHSKSLIRAAISERPQVVAIVPRFAVAGDAGPVDAWMELDASTGEIYGRMQDGLYGASSGAGWNISNVQKPFRMQRKVLNYYFGRIAAWYLFAAGALDSVEKAMDNPAMTLKQMHRNAAKVARDLAKMYDSWVLNVPGNPITDPSFLKGLKDGLDWAEKFYGEAWKD
ncbi:MAG: carboxypeptidase-like regulatory domain-containing protein [Planctomycetota bacterium]